MFSFKHNLIMITTIVIVICIIQGGQSFPGNDEVNTSRLEADITMRGIYLLFIIRYRI